MASSGRVVSLATLVRVARLTPQQALAIAAEVVGQLAERHAAGSAVGGFDEHGVGVGLDGRARLVGRAPRPTPRRSEAASVRADPASIRADAASVRADPASIRADAVSARRMLAHLGRNLQDGDRSPRNGRPSERAVTAGALTSALDLDGGIAACAVTLGVAAAPTRRQARAELAALVSALGGAPAERRRTDPSVPAVIPGTTGSEAPEPEPPAGDRPTAAPGAGSRAVGTVVRAAAVRSGRWFLAALALVGLLTVELVVFGNRIESDLATLHAAGRAAGPATASPAPTPPAAAPTANGPVTKVDLRPLTSCSPGLPCEARLQVRLRPGPEVRELRWAFRVTDRCTGASWTAPGGSMRVGAGGDQLAAVATVPLPPGRALGITAVVGPPAAASPPLLVPVDATC